MASCVFCVRGVGGAGGHLVRCPGGWRVADVGGPAFRGAESGGSQDKHKRKQRGSAARSFHCRRCNTKKNQFRRHKIVGPRKTEPGFVVSNGWRQAAMKYGGKKRVSTDYERESQSMTSIFICFRSIFNNADDNYSVETTKS